jgi:AraC-like DNA-binding protein
MTVFGTALHIQLLNADQCSLDSSWHYCDIISPFTRIYLISSGSGYIFPNNQKTLLEAGYLYIVPAFIPCSYMCTDTMEQYYLHFTTHTVDELNIFDFNQVLYKIKASDNDCRLFDRLLELNPDIQLRVPDPLLNEQKSWLNNEVKYRSMAHYFETTGLIYQLFSRFFVITTINTEPIMEADSRIQKTLKYIHQHIDQDLSIKELARNTCLSGDHFTRAFKRTTGQTPLDYINRKRLEKAQLLLITTNLSLKEIFEKTGFNSASYFNRIFKKATSLTPLEYRRSQLTMFGSSR